MKTKNIYAPVALVTAVTKVRDLIVRRDVRSVTDNYNIGRELNDIVRGVEVYGADARKYIRQEFDTSQTGILVMMRVARRFTRVQINAMVALRTPKGDVAITWSHVRELVRLKDNAHVTSLANQAAEHGLGARELRRMVQSVSGTAAPGSWRRSKVYTFEGIVDDIIAKCGTLTNQADRVWLNASDGLAELGRVRTVARPRVGWDDGDMLDKAHVAAQNALRRLNKTVATLGRMVAKRRAGTV